METDFRKCVPIIDSRIETPLLRRARTEAGIPGDEEADEHAEEMEGDEDEDGRRDNSSGEGR